MSSSPSNAGAGYEGLSLTEMLQDCCACGVVMVDSQGKATTLTSHAKRLIGPSGDRKQAVSAEKLPGSLLAIVREAQKIGKLIANREVALELAGESARTFSVTAIPLVSSAPRTKTMSVVLLLQDLSSTQKLEHHMQRLNRLASIGTLSASMAHEIKNALVPVKTFVELILERNPKAELAGTVDRELNRIDAIVSRMLRFAVPAKPAFAPVRLHQLLEHSLLLVQHRVESKQIAFTRRFKASSDSCSGDDHQLEQAFVNLLFNAVEAMGSEGKLTVSTDLINRDPEIQLQNSGKARLLRIEIKDTGDGITPQDMGSIFDPFFTTKQHGTGLGLAVTRRVIEEHNGAIRVKSQPGKGTTFSVYLPAGA